MLCQQHWWLVPSLFLIIFFFWGSFFKRPFVDFLVLGGPRRLAFVLSFSKAFRFHFFRPTFWLLSLLSFFPGKLIPFCQVESFPATFFHSSSFWVPRGTSPLFMNCWFPSLLIPFLHHYVVDRDVSVLLLCVSWYAPLNCLNPNLALLHVPRIPGTWESPGILAQFFS